MRAKTFPCSLACRYYTGCCSAGSTSSDSDPEKQSLTVCFPQEHKTLIAKVSQETESSGKYLCKIYFSDIANYFNIVQTKGCVRFVPFSVAVRTYHWGFSRPQLSPEGQAPHQGAHQCVSHDQTAPRKLPLGGAARALEEIFKEVASSTSVSSRLKAQIPIKVQHAEKSCSWEDWNEMVYVISLPNSKCSPEPPFWP